MEMESPLMVVAIDFGTTFSSWACSLRHEYEENPTKVHVRQWVGGDHISAKAPTTVLIRPDGKTLEAFGYEAEDRYADLVEKGGHKLWYYFRRFKMKIYNDDSLSRTTVIKDATGKPLPAMMVFSRTIQFMKDDFLKQFQRTMEGHVQDRDIRWVLTVPAIWNERAKQFMRQAAVTAGIRDEYLKLALEPEAASLLCNHLPMKKFVANGSETASISTFEKGSKYLILDAGGGTVDITIHEVITSGKIKELHKASGGPWGGTKVDEAFQQFIMKLVGSPVFSKFSNETFEDLQEMFRSFEVKKRDIYSDKNCQVILRVPISLIQLFERETGNTLEESVKKYCPTGKMKLVNDKLKVESSVMKEFYTDTINYITSHVISIFEDKHFADVKSIIMVGGFSECSLLQQAIQDCIPHKNVIIAMEPGLAVLKGAVIFGHNPEAVLERICRYTYGVAGSKPFVDGHHRKTFKKSYGAGELCNNVFVKIVECGQKIKLNERQPEQILKMAQDRTEQVFSIYVSDKPSPMYITDEGCSLIGTLTISGLDTSVALSHRKIALTLMVGGTEMEVEAREVHTGNTSKTVMDFLG
ncbi:hypothetical protein CHS0354_007575 [Potamilus streckersoni]|uniref:Uncharacterized protein n=1 Tax=Potamilus streckersoni TaxID=2493646 RepID=A0AAE0T4K0_9BIVA|nr:hypothetical protein CHS0354_007575 [Potamilus streckersoni]